MPGKKPFKKSDGEVAGTERPVPFGNNPSRTTAPSLLAMIAHDLRSPLAVIQGYSHLLEGDLPPDIPVESRGYLATIKAHATLLNHMIDSLVLVDQASQAQWPHHFARRYLADLVEPAVDEIAVLAAEKGVVFRIDAQGDPIGVDIDERAVRQALYNLLWYAIQNARPGGEVSLGIDSVDRFARITLCDPRCESLQDTDLATLLIIPDPDGNREIMALGVSDLSLLAAGVVAVAHDGRLETAQGPQGGVVVRLYLPMSRE